MFIQNHSIPEDIVKTPGSPWFVIPGNNGRRRRRRNRRQKRGKRAGVWERLRKTPHKPPIPSIFLTNARSIANKMDELRLQLVENRLCRDCCALMLTESWLHPGIPDAAVELTDFTLHRHDRNHLSQKQRDWSVFESQDLEEYTTSVLSYIKHCTDTVTTEKHIRVYANQKPWMTAGVRILLKERNIAFKSGDKERYSAARANLKTGIRGAKLKYKHKIEGYLHSNNSRQVWQGIQNITNYRPNPRSVGVDNTLAEELNCFFARFEQQSAEEATLHSLSNPSHVFTVEEDDVRKVLRTVNPRKAAGPDGITGRVLKDCADELTGVFTKIFNLSP
ncbi:uncharacterized protein [Danio rerio]|uniref:Uncharacterized protein n=1 Tax=Danio rerio TaxID=7955 RepID=A0AC58GS90_DANRE